MDKSLHVESKPLIPVKNYFFVFFLFSSFYTFSQDLTQWYNNAQDRIDTLRKGNFEINILDKNGQPFSGDVKVKLSKHAFPFGIAFDLYDNPGNNGNSYFTTQTVSASADMEIYQTERWNTNVAYAIPVEKGKDYKLTFNPT